VGLLSYQCNDISNKVIEGDCMGGGDELTRNPTKCYKYQKNPYLCCRKTIAILSLYKGIGKLHVVANDAQKDDIHCRYSYNTLIIV